MQKTVYLYDAIIASTRFSLQTTWRMIQRYYSAVYATLNETIVDRTQ